MYCIARRRDVDRCAFERANLMIGATDIVVMAQRMPQTPQATSPRQRERRAEGARLFQWREVRRRIARVSRMQVVRG